MNFRQALFGGTSNNSTIAETGLFLLRVFAGLALAFSHGYAKIETANRFISGAVSGLGLPAPMFFGWAAIGAEFLGGLLLALGLLTRPAAFFILCVMLTAVFGVHAADPFGKKELALLYGFIALAFLFIGSGRFGFDSLIRGGRGYSRR